MSENTYQHVCKEADGGCGRTYTSLEPDPYFCKDCIQTRKALYQKIDKQVKPVKHVKSSHELFMEKGKTIKQRLPDGTEVITTRMRV